MQTTEKVSHFYNLEHEYMIYKLQFWSKFDLPIGIPETQTIGENKTINIKPSPSICYRFLFHFNSYLKLRETKTLDDEGMIFTDGSSARTACIQYH